MVILVVFWIFLVWGVFVFFFVEKLSIVILGLILNILVVFVVFIVIFVSFCVLGLMLIV